MKVGLKLVHSGPGATPDLMLRWTRYAEAMGFHLLMTADHIALTREVLGVISLRPTTSPSPIWHGWPPRPRRLSSAPP